VGNESAIILPIPEVEAVVGQLRMRYDRSAALGVPAHVTLLYPFCPPQAVSAEIETLRDICSRIKRFAFSFVEVRRFPATAYLHPDNGEAFAQITRTLLRAWPDYQPYRGAHSDIVPHLTVADPVDSETLKAVEDTLRGHLPIQCLAREISLLISDDSGLWSKEASFSLGVSIA
jgi:2'-5' RNA ligase